MRQERGIQTTVIAVLAVAILVVIKHKYILSIIKDMKRKK